RPRKKVYTGNPVRKELLKKQPSSVISKAFSGLSILHPPPSILLILGGSQGAQALNQLVSGALPDLLDLGVVIHQTGRGGLEEALVAKSRVEEGKQMRYQPIDFIETKLLGALYQRAILVIARSGGTVAEFSAFGLPAILVPLPDSAQNHQEENAIVYTQAGAAILLKQSLLSPAKLALRAKELINNPRRRSQMSAATKKLFVPDAAARIADLIESTYKP
ncbi:undecaprenyldiphospho-muramoylpentapeptide beta-N-acetylglucosaminyltransferase, partial [Candidatus Berkelbacteria bacterium]|nr:undecaprenyldiphospho-muramoylpentapeptide beta-N-acetylglucosaminyltransferase [Candidatus Berkelbacteria bacterium]